MITILGGGFIGNALAQHLQASSRTFYQITRKECDLSNADQLKALLPTSPEVVIVSAATTRLKDGSEVAYKNNLALAHSIKSLRPHHLIFLSTIDVYGREVNAPLTEDMIPVPADPYSRSKFESEAILGGTTLRLTGVFGNNDFGQSTIGQMADQAFNKGMIPLFNQGRDLRDFLFIDDLIQIITYFCDAKIQGTFNVASGESHSIRSYAEWVAKSSPHPVALSLQRECSSRSYDIHVDISRLKEAMPHFEATEPFRAIQAYSRSQLCQI